MNDHARPARLAMIRQRKPMLSQRTRDWLNNAAAVGVALMLILSSIGAASTWDMHNEPEPPHGETKTLADL